ncbi:MAG: hypothetical protein V2A79_10125 [Planctomycetota bacterium]
MNINQSLYDGAAVRAEIDRLMAEGLDFSEALGRLIDDILETTRSAAVREGEQGIVHGVKRGAGTDSGPNDRRRLERLTTE